MKNQEKEVKFDDLIEDVKLWALDKDLLKKENSPKQFVKIVEELGELASAMLKDRSTVDIIDAIGDTFVTLIILSYQLSIHPTDALEAAYIEIKNRTGKTVNGTFIKNEDTSKN
jgi:NTP pyrophosphatase (non-canonical NTP hydrolase)